MHEKVNARLRESCLLAPSHLLGRIHSTYHTAFSFIYVLFCQQIFPHYLIKLEFLLPQLRDLSLYREKGGSKGVVRLAHVPTDTIAKMIGVQVVRRTSQKRERERERERDWIRKAQRRSGEETTF